MWWLKDRKLEQRIEVLEHLLSNVAGSYLATNGLLTATLLNADASQRSETVRLAKGLLGKNIISKTPLPSLGPKNDQALKDAFSAVCMSLIATLEQK